MFSTKTPVCSKRRNHMTYIHRKLRFAFLCSALAVLCTALAMPIASHAIPVDFLDTLLVLPLAQQEVERGMDSRVRILRVLLLQALDERLQ